MTRSTIRGASFWPLLLTVLQETSVLGLGNVNDGVHAVATPTADGVSRSLGCFENVRGTVSTQSSMVRADFSRHMTQKMCLVHCHEMDYAFYGLKDGNECWCGPHGMDLSGFMTSTKCDTICSGDSGSKCGGCNAMSLFGIEEDDGVDSAGVEFGALPHSDSFSSRRLDSTSMATVAATSASTSDVSVDLRPCILSPEEIADTGATAAPYVISNFYSGFWGSSMVVLVAPGDDLVSEMTDTDDSSHGLCNAVFVGIVPTAAQYSSLELYSKTFKVRIVYLEASNSAADASVMSKLGIQQYFAGDILTPASMAFTDAGGATARILNSALTTDPIGGGMYTRPVRVVADANATIGTTTRIAEYLDSNGDAIFSDGYHSVAMMLWEGVDDVEEMHMFVSIAWFDAGSWAWAHHLVEWATKGIFVGERRFYLGAVVDDMFLKTAEFSYGKGGVGEDGKDLHEGTEYRCSGDDMTTLKTVQDSLNTKYSSSIITEFAFNGAGILEEVGSAYTPSYSEALLTVKGTKMDGVGDQPLVHPEDYLSVTVPLLEAEYATGLWDTDELLAAVLAFPDDFYHGSHTLVHLNRDELQESDCNIEDGANAQIAVITGMFAMESYNWRSMVSPGITGLFNKNCLQSGKNNLMTCYPGDNTYDGVNTVTSLISSVSPYHSIYTTEATNGLDGMQIVPRFATYVYYNCVSASCLINENEYIRRIVCGCSELDPSKDRGTCSNVGTVNGCNSDSDISSFASYDDLFDTEAKTATRYLLSGRRDKYMFHQANVVPAADLDGKSTLQYWYEMIMASVASYITFPVKSTKFDDLCVNFQEHETLDSSDAVVTATFQSDGSISGMSLSFSSAAGLIPVTVPTSEVQSISLGSLSSYSSETYGSDTTYYVATSTSAEPKAAPIPDSSELAPIDITAATAVTVSESEIVANEVESEEAQEVIEEVAMEQGLVPET